MTHIYKFLITVILFLLASTAFSNQWNVDQAHSEVRFEVKHIHTTVTGHFSDFNGDVFFNPDNLGESKFDFTVNVKSVDTNNGKRDNHLRSKDFFNSKKFPVMTFKSTKVTHKKDNFYELEGEITIKDVTKEVKLKFQFFEPKQHPANKKKLVSGFETDLTISRLDFNVGNGKFLKMGVVGEDVYVEIVFEALRNK